MAVKLPSLFDDDEFLVPKPEKETKKKKIDPPKTEDEKEEFPIVENASSNNISENLQIPEASIIENAQEQLETKSVQPEIQKEDQPSQKTLGNIIFEFPSEDENEMLKPQEPKEIELQEKPETDTKGSLDFLYRQELTLQDYTAFMDFPETIASKEQAIVQEEIKTQLQEEKTETNSVLFSESPKIEAIDFSFEDEPIQTAEPLPEFNLEDKYYPIGEVAEMFQVNVSHIRFWTKEFDLLVRTTRKGDRLYNPENIARLRLIHHLVKENGFTIKGAKEKLKVQKESVDVNIDLRENLVALREKLEVIKKNL
ncbi:MAG TPA: MerR family transcriptional regulator [Edaphocola sp.]|nr:MerR family transcriptional regulator [Edaphocola sp.]